MARTTQLRTYQIAEGRLDDFVDGWRAAVVPLRKRFGFHVQEAWVDRTGSLFVWLVSYDGPEGFEARDRAYYASPDRDRLDPDPAGLIVSSEHRFVEPVALS